MQKLLEIHCSNRKKTALCLDHGYYHAVYMGSNYVGIFFLGHGVEVYVLHMKAQSHPHYASEAFDVFRNFKTTFCKNGNHLGNTDFTIVYRKVQKNKTGD